MKEVVKRITAVTIVAVLALSIGMLAMAGNGFLGLPFGSSSGSGSAFGGGQGSGSSNSPQAPDELPPFPGMDDGDLEQAPAEEGMCETIIVPPLQPTLSPSGFLTTGLFSYLPVTISGIAPTWTRVQIAEWTFWTGWVMVDLTGFYLSGSVTVTFFADSPGPHVLVAWVDNNHNNSVDPGEVTQYLFIMVV